MWPRSGLALLEALDKGVGFVAGEGRRQCLGILGMCSRRPLIHTLGFLVLSFCKVPNISIGKSFAVVVGHSSSMLHQSNLLESIFQGNLHSNKRVVVQLVTISKEEGRKDARSQLVVPDASCGESLAMVSHVQ